MIRSRALRYGALFICILLGAGIFYRVKNRGAQSEGLAPKNALTKAQLALALSDKASFFQFPTELELPVGESENVKGVLEYAFDPALQESMQSLFRAYRPDYGAFVAMDATTGQILSMVSYSRYAGFRENLALRSTFPSASVFKVVTAAAAIEGGKYSADSVIAFNGRNHTLYRSNILKTQYNRWTRYITLKDAFAKSVNTVFGRIGAYTVGATELQQYANRFGFNRAIAADVPVQPGSAMIPDDPWKVAEAASGYTRDNTMSPLQGAMIAAAIANDGVMMEPFVVKAVFSPHGERLYLADPRVANFTVDPKTAAEVREMMRETVTRGTSRGSFKRFFRGNFRTIDVGGKTGSLSGKEPPGKYDWFVGYADGGSRKIAIAALTINGRYWTVKSSYVARKAIEKYFKDQGW